MKRLALAAFIAGILGTGSLAVSHAGRVISWEVHVVDSRIAYGSLGSAHNSADSVQKIGCSVRVASSDISGFCSAKTSAGALLMCSTRDPLMLELMKTINGGSSLYFTADSGVCTYLRVYNSSEYESR